MIVKKLKNVEKIERVWSDIIVSLRYLKSLLEMLPNVTLI